MTRRSPNRKLLVALAALAVVAVIAVDWVLSAWAAAGPGPSR